MNLGENNVSLSVEFKANGRLASSSVASSQVLDFRNRAQRRLLGCSIGAWKLKKREGRVIALPW